MLISFRNRGNTTQELERRWFGLPNISSINLYNEYLINPRNYLHKVVIFSLSTYTKHGGASEYRVHTQT